MKYLKPFGAELQPPIRLAFFICKTKYTMGNQWVANQINIIL